MPMPAPTSPYFDCRGYTELVTATRIRDVIEDQSTLTAASNTSTLMPALHRPIAKTTPQMPPPTMATPKSRGLVSVGTGMYQRKMKAFFCEWVPTL
jgi:hypothetical protein